MPTDKLTGRVKRLVKAKGFGFIAATDGREYFFHLSSLATRSAFDSLVEGDAVEFVIVASHKGPRAADVRVTG
jgi:CspA family cold shock protein